MNIWVTQPYLQRPKFIFYNKKLSHYTCLCLPQRNALGWLVGSIVFINCLYQAKIMLVITVFDNTHTVINVVLNSTDIWLLGLGRNIDTIVYTYW